MYKKLLISTFSISSILAATQVQPHERDSAVNFLSMLYPDHLNPESRPPVSRIIAVVHGKNGRAVTHDYVPTDKRAPFAELGELVPQLSKIRQVTLTCEFPLDAQDSARIVEGMNGDLNSTTKFLSRIADEYLRGLYQATGLCMSIPEPFKYGQCRTRSQEIMQITQGFVGVSVINPNTTSPILSINTMLIKPHVTVLRC